MDCAVVICSNPRQFTTRPYCKAHNEIVRKHGSAEPIFVCDGCGALSTWVLGQGKYGGKYKYCPVCLELVIQYREWIPSGLARHGLTIMRFIETIVEQKFSCKICQKPFTPKKGMTRRNFAIDHNHKHCLGSFGCKACFRSLLCQGCNTMVGFVETDKDRLDKVLEYCK